MIAPSLSHADSAFVMQLVQSLAVGSEAVAPQGCPLPAEPGVS